MKTAVIYDFHGTLADVSPILHLVTRDKDYDGFYEQSLSCAPIIPTVVAAQRSREDGHHNLLLTGMPRRYESGLRVWLSDQGVHMDAILMREPEDGYRRDFIIKHRMYREVVNLGYYVVRAWEDSPGVLDLWGKLGLETVPIPRYEYDTAEDRVDRNPAVT